MLTLAKRIRNYSALLTLGALMVAAAGCASHPAAQTSAVAGRPGCAPPFFTLSQAAASSPVGQKVSLTAIAQPAASVRVLSVNVVAARPGANLDQTSQADSVTQKANQLASSGRSNWVPAGEALPLAFTPPARGDYQIVAYGSYVTAPDCSAPAPAQASAGQGTSFLVVLGTITAA
jgi:hypothetical protein